MACCVARFDKWLKAGVMEGAQRFFPRSGTPQGGVVSPVIANVYLHTVLDEWFEKEMVPRLLAEAHLIRYADDFVRVFREAPDAYLVFDLLAQRFAEFGLKLHPRQDPADPLSASTVGTVTERPACPQKLRLPGIQLPLGPLSKGRLGGEADDGPESFHPGRCTASRSGVDATGTFRSPSSTSTSFASYEDTMATSESSATCTPSLACVTRS